MVIELGLTSDPRIESWITLTPSPALRKKKKKNFSPNLFNCPVIIPYPEFQHKFIEVDQLSQLKPNKILITEESKRAGLNPPTITDQPQFFRQNQVNLCGETRTTNKTCKFNKKSVKNQLPSVLFIN